MCGHSMRTSSSFTNNMGNSLTNSYIALQQQGHRRYFEKVDVKACLCAACGHHNLTVHVSALRVLTVDHLQLGNHVVSHR